jgi:uncharacterized repeat protein (TIGR01451 family)
MSMHPRMAGLVLSGILGLSAAMLVQAGSLFRGGQVSLSSSIAADLCVPCEQVIAGAAIPPCQDDPPVPVVTLRVRVPATVVAGQELEYHICVENCSAAAAHHVLVRDPLPANAHFVRAVPPPSAREPELVWTLGTLEPCECRDIVVVLAPTGMEDIKNCARVQFEHGQCVCTKIARGEIQLHKSGPSQAALNDTLPYRLAVTNTGGAPVTAVQLTDTLPVGLEPVGGKTPMTWDIGALAPGQSRTVDYQAVAKAPGRLCNRASATASGGLHAEAESCVVVGEAKLTLTKTGPARRYLNMNAAYQLTVTNAGTVPLTNVAITDPLPPKTTLVRASNGGQRSDNDVNWSLGTLQPGTSRTVELVLRSQDAGRVCNRASARADRGLTAQAEACTEFIGVSALLLEVVDTEDPVEVGAETSYVILIRNQGTEPATNVHIEALVPEQMDVTRVTGPSDNRKEGRRILFSPLTLQPHSDARYVVYIRAIQPGDVRFKVDLFADILTSGPVHEEESTTIYTDISR